MDQKQKQTLTDARSYGGAETSSDHRLVVARMELDWPRLYYKRPPVSRQQKFDTKHLVQNEDAQNGYKAHVTHAMQSIEQSRQEPTMTHKWEKLKTIIKSAAESHIGYQKKESKQHIPDPQLERMSKEQKDLPLELESSNTPERKRILKEMSQRVKEAKEKRAEELVGEIETAKDDTRMFKAAKALYTKH